MIKKYKKKAVVIEAIQWTGDNSDEVKSFLGDKMFQISNQQVKIYTLEGIMAASPNDYIIRGITGEFYPCKPDIFSLTYEETLADNALQKRIQELEEDNKTLLENNLQLQTIDSLDCRLLAKSLKKVQGLAKQIIDLIGD